MKRVSMVRARKTRCGALLGLWFAIPLLMGGCPDYRTDLVGVLATATRSALFSNDDAVTITNTVRASLVDATLSLLFSQLAGDGGN